MRGLCGFAKPVCAVLKLPVVPPVTAEVLLEHPARVTEAMKAKRRGKCAIFPAEMRTRRVWTVRRGKHQDAAVAAYLYEAMAGGWDA